MPQQSKSERRKEQNRRAQATHRRKRQQRLQYLEEQLGFLDSLSSPVSVEPSDGRDAANDLTQQPQDTSGVPEPDFDDTSLPYLDQGALQMFSRLDGTFGQSYFPTPSSDAATSRLNGSDADWSRHFSQSDPAPGVHQAGNFTAKDSIRGISGKAPCYTFDAIASNAKLLGYPNEALIKATFESKFFSPLSSLDTSWLPEALRPTMAQMTYPHQPYIDCIPLPDLRSRIILALSHRPALICSLDLWYDILLGGLSCETDPQDGLQWCMDDTFVLKWKELLTCDIGTLLAQTLGSNPPVRVVFPA